MPLRQVSLLMLQNANKASDTGYNRREKEADVTVF